MDADRHRSHSTTRKEHLFDILFVEYRGTEFLDEVARLFDGGDCNENENRNESSTQRSSSVENDVDFEKKEANELPLRVRQVRTHNGDITLVPTEGHAFVSPGNSMGFMDGGVDYALSRTVLPGCETRLRELIRELGFVTHLGRPYLRVGSALTVTRREWGSGTCLVAAPTMFLPHDVSGTHNAYHAFYAALGAFSKHIYSQMYGCSGERGGRGGGVDNVAPPTLVCPALCCGYGKMDPKESARQVHAAYVDFSSSPLSRVWDVAFEGLDAYSKSRDRDHAFLTRSKDAEQPDNFDTREIKSVPVERM